MKLLTILSASILLILSSCSGGKQMATSSSSLYDTKWVLKKIHGEAGLETVDTKAFIRFDQQKGSAGGNGSCNSFGSNAAINGSNVTFTNIFSTKMFCEAVQKTENAFLAKLEKITKFSISGSTLILYQGEEPALEFSAE